MEQLWWKKHLRIVQYNMQSKDTGRIDPEELARQTEEMGFTAAVVNAVDSVLWADLPGEETPVNPYLPKGRDLLKEMIAAFHRRGIRVIARGAYMGMEEDTYYRHPEWAARTPEGAPIALGNDRPGLWKRLYAICPNAGFLREDGRRIAQRIFEKYDFDGGFWFGGGMQCFCDLCKLKYKEATGTEMSADPKMNRPGWDAALQKADANALRDAVFEVRGGEIPWFRYYWGLERNERFGERVVHLPAGNLARQAQEGNAMLTEAQDVLSRGTEHIPEWNTGMLDMKLGRAMGKEAPPIGIIHTCPGMDWRHACMPEEEFLYWAAQIPANGGSLWVSMTGIPDTICDKRMLRAVKALNEWERICEAEMAEAVSRAQVLLLSNGSMSTKGWADALTGVHLDFDMTSADLLREETLRKYPVVIAPKDFRYPAGSGAWFAAYVNAGGRLLAEGTRADALNEVIDLLGTEGVLSQSEEVEATYLRLEDDGAKAAVGETELVPLKGRIGFTHPKEGTKTLASWVPQFAPAIFAGLPPERASLPAEQTDIPLVLSHAEGAGEVTFVSFEASRLAREYALKDMLRLMGHLVQRLLGDRQDLWIDAPARVMVSVFETEDAALLHFVNGVGQRPLTDVIEISGIRVRMKQNGKTVRRVTARLAGEDIPFAVGEGVLSFTLPPLSTWEMVRVEYA